MTGKGRPMARFGDGLAFGPDLLTAAEDAVAQAIAPLEAGPDLVCVFVSGEDPEVIDAAARCAMRAARSPIVLGCSASGVAERARDPPGFPPASLPGPGY